MSDHTQAPIQEFVARIQEDRRRKTGRLNYLVVAPTIAGLRMVILDALKATGDSALVPQRKLQANILMAGDVVIRFSHPEDDVRGIFLDGALKSSMCRADAWAVRVMNDRLQRRGGWLLVD